MANIFRPIIESGNKSLTILSDCCFSGMWTTEKVVKSLGFYNKNLSIISASEPNEVAYDR